jgi:hypothetical protein
LNILPVDGAYYRWSAGDGLNGVAKFFGVTPEDIINFSGNKLDPTRLGDWSAPNIEPGAWLVIPGGRREFVSWSAPVIPLDNPGVAKVLGPGACENVLGGAVGTGVFVPRLRTRFQGSITSRRPTTPASTLPVRKATQSMLPTAV